MRAAVRCFKWTCTDYAHRAGVFYVHVLQSTTALTAAEFWVSLVYMPIILLVDCIVLAYLLRWEDPL